MNPGPEPVAPTVILCSGAAMPGEIWDAVRALLPGHRIVHLDRPGVDLPRDRRGPQAAPPPTLASAERRLLGLLEQADGPAVLVAHSMSAFLVEAVARLRPDLVRELVLLDPSTDPPGSEPRPLPRRVQRTLLAMASLAPTMPWPSSLRPRNVPWWGIYLFRPGAVGAATAESLGYASWSAALQCRRSEVPRLDVPVTALVALGTASRPVPGRWVQLQHELALLLRRDGSPRVTVRLLPRCSHLVMRDAPGAVADTIAAAAARHTS